MRLLRLLLRLLRLLLRLLRLLRGLVITRARAKLVVAPNRHHARRLAEGNALEIGDLNLCERTCVA